MADELYARVGAAIRSRRETAGLTQEAVASRTSLKRSSVTNIERGGQAILLHQLYELARVFDADPCEFMVAANLPDPAPDAGARTPSRATELLDRLDRLPGPKRR